MGRRWPDLLWALALGTALLAVGTGLGADLVWLLAPPAFLVSLLAGRRMASLRPALLVVALWALVVPAVSLAREGAGFWSPTLAAALVAFPVVVLPWWLGRYRRLRSEHVEQERAVVAAQARLRERARIATDMHDSLGHDLALMALRSGALERDPEATEQQRTVAAELRASAVRATDRLHEILGVLREEGAAAPRRPEGEDVDELVTEARAAGVDVRLSREAADRSADWAPPVRQAVHRVTQEALTNAARHAPGRPVTVHVAEKGEQVVLEVANPLGAPPRGTAARGGGQGLVALEERVRLLGGTLRAGAHGGRFVLRAELPRRAEPGVADDGPFPAHARTLGEVRRRRRARTLQTAALPLVLAVGLLASLLSVQAMTVRQTALHPDAYASVRTGQTREQVSALLPSSSQEAPPPVIEVLPAPPASDCEFFQARAHVLDLTSDMYRLCFRGDVVVSKDRLVPRR